MNLALVLPPVVGKAPVPSRPLKLNYAGLAELRTFSQNKILIKISKGRKNEKLDRNFSPSWLEWVFRIDCDSISRLRESLPANRLID